MRNHNAKPASNKPMIIVINSSIKSTKFQICCKGRGLECKDIARELGNEKKDNSALSRGAVNELSPDIIRQNRRSN